MRVHHQLPKPVLILLAALFVSAPRATAETDASPKTRTETVGTAGLVVDMPEGWKRSKNNDDLGDDQFRSGGYKFLAIIQVGGYLNSEAMLAAKIARLKANWKELGVKGTSVPLTTISDGNVRAVRERFDTSEGSVRLSYYVAAIGFEGCAWLFLGWSSPARFEDLEKDLTFMLEHSRIDGTNDFYKRLVRRSDARFKTAGHDVRLGYAAEFYEERTNAADALATIASGDGSVVVSALPESRLESAAAFFRDRERELSDGDGKPERAGWLPIRDNPDLVALAAKRAVPGFLDTKRLRYETYALPEDRGSYALCLYVPLTRTEGFQIRCVAKGDPETAELAASYLLGRLDVKPVLAAFPEKVEATVPSASRLTGFLAATKSSARFDGSATDAILLADGTTRVVTSKGIYSYKDGRTRAVFAFDGYGYGVSAAALGADLYTAAGSSGDVELVGKDGGELQTWKANRLFSSPSGGSLLAVRKSPDPFARLACGADLPEILVRRFASGAEEVIVEHQDRIACAGFDAKENSLLVALAYRWFEADGFGCSLVVVDPAKRARVEAGRWDSVERIVPAESGWLVSGRPENGPDGVWLVAQDGARTLLVGNGEFQAVGVADGRLFLASNYLSDDGTQTWSATSLRSVPLARLQEFASSIARPEAATLDAIARKLGYGETVPALASGAEVSKAAAAVRAALVEAGYAAPDTPEAFDRFIEDFAYYDRPGSGGFRILLALYAGMLVDRGAVWVDSADPSPEGFHARFDTLETPFAVPLCPVETLYSALYEEEGVYEPAASAFANLQGRILLVGHDHATLGRAIEAKADPALAAAAASNDPALVAAFLAKPSNARNEWLHAAVLRGLAARGQSKALTEVIARLGALGAKGPYEDLFSLLVAHRSGGKLDHRTAWETAEHLPDEALAFFLLGASWEASENGRDNALACYSKATEMYGAPGVAEEAARAAERLEGNVRPPSED